MNSRRRTSSIGRPIAVAGAGNFPTISALGPRVLGSNLNCSESNGQRHDRFGVNHVDPAMSTIGPLYPELRTSADATGMSQKCQQRPTLRALIHHADPTRGSKFKAIADSLSEGTMTGRKGLSLAQ
jgi:hypothetical protein